MIIKYSDSERLITLPCTLSLKETLEKHEGYYCKDKIAIKRINKTSEVGYDHKMTKKRLASKTMRDLNIVPTKNKGVLNG